MDISTYIGKIRHLDPASHKGQNGKIMIIGGSELFHAASKWALDTASAMVDMVFYSSVPENNELIHEAKANFWSGVVIPRGEIENYIDEADVILIGPGMTRVDGSLTSKAPYPQQLAEALWNSDTEAVTNFLLNKYPEKKWVIDAGALQMVNPSLLTSHCIITPHQGEFERVLSHITRENAESPMSSILESKVTVLLKGEVDKVFSVDREEIIEGGNAGMTKGGTGDALAGLVAGLYAFSDDPFAVAVVASYVNKKAGDELYKSVGPFFTTNQLVEQIPKTLKEVLGY